MLTVTFLLLSVTKNNPELLAIIHNILYYIDLIIECMFVERGSVMVDTVVADNGMVNQDAGRSVEKDHEFSSAKLFLFRTSWFFATYIAYLLSIRDANNEIYRDEEGVTITLGSILLEPKIAPAATPLPASVSTEVATNTIVEKVLKPFTLESFKEKHPGSDILVVQVLENFEIHNSPIVSSRLRALSVHQDSTITVTRLPLVDFSTDMQPKEDFFRKFHSFYEDVNERMTTYNETKQAAQNDSTPLPSPPVFYIHCKAGVNRSFKVSAALRSLLELSKEDANKSFSLADVVNKVSEVCADIKEKRTCVFLNSKNYINQISFISHLVLNELRASQKLAVDVPQEINNDAMKTAIKTSLETFITPNFLLKSYIKNTNSRKTDYSSFVATLFKPVGCDRDTKVSAATRFLHDAELARLKAELARLKDQGLDGESPEIQHLTSAIATESALVGEYSEKELIALQDGSLRSLIKHSIDQFGAPEVYAAAIERERELEDDNDIRPF